MFLYVNTMALLSNQTKVLAHSGNILARFEWLPLWLNRSVFAVAASLSDFD